MLVFAEAGKVRVGPLILTDVNHREGTILILYREGLRLKVPIHIQAALVQQSKRQWRPVQRVNRPRSYDEAYAR